MRTTFALLFLLAAYSFGIGLDLKQLKKIVEPYLTALNVTENHRTLIRCLTPMMARNWANTTGELMHRTNWNDSNDVAVKYRAFANMTVDCFNGMMMCSSDNSTRRIYETMRDITWNETDFGERVNDTFNELTEGLRSYGSQFAARRYESAGMFLGNVTYDFFFDDNMTVFTE
ncbi:MAG: hypothetical protein P4M11_08750 [Candidatus Pacebacteria bacterium]|nr:hypothetical protein [Candidatus Paceibacterota bacterium]